MLLRLAYVTVTNACAVLRLLPMTDRDKDTEILVLRHQIAVLERQLAGKRVRFTTADGGSTLIVDTGCYAAAASLDDLCSYSTGLR